MNLKIRLTFHIFLILLVQTGLLLILHYFFPDLYLILLPVSSLLIFMVLFFVMDSFLAPVKRIINALETGISCFKDNDFSVTINDDGYKEMGFCVSSYNEAAKKFHNERMELYQKELLLDMIIQSTPLALILTNERDAIVYSNPPAKLLFGLDNKLEGHRLKKILNNLPPQLKQATLNKKSGLVTEYIQHDKQTYSLNYQEFILNTQKHHLYLYRNITKEISRQEIEVWKNVIRLISHELNNSLAPITSLINSAQKIVQQEKHLDMLPDMFKTIARRSSHLQQFIQSYAKLSRLPAPDKKPVLIDPFIHSIAKICCISITNQTEIKEASFDAAQIEQVLINLIKNAKESESDPVEIKCLVTQSNNSLNFIVKDRGKGMTDSQAAQALMPFYTTKPQGTGIGLALCNEIITAHGGHLTLFNRKEGGLEVSFVLPVSS